ncbi:MAG: hypothetical protein WBF84_16955 [Castellaniella sp.]|uniref:hypothetical protein n=1 Tax=Castellaniella sp. TaxID=1955812 RepID=UPI003C709CE1
MTWRTRMTSAGIRRGIDVGSLPIEAVDSFRVGLETPVTNPFREESTMEKMSSKEFTVGMDKFLKILESQPNLLVSRHPSAGEGAKIADMASGFINRLHQLRLEAIQGGEE